MKKFEISQDLIRNIRQVMIYLKELLPGVQRPMSFPRNSSRDMAYRNNRSPISRSRSYRRHISCCRGFHLAPASKHSENGPSDLLHNLWHCPHASEDGEIIERTSAPQEPYNPKSQFPRSCRWDSKLLHGRLRSQRFSQYGSCPTACFRSSCPYEQSSDSEDNSTYDTKPQNQYSR